MLCRDLFICLQATAYHFAPKQPSECFLNLPCHCCQPGQTLQCEDCPYLEACLSRFKPAKITGNDFNFKANS